MNITVTYPTICGQLSCLHSPTTQEGLNLVNVGKRKGNIMGWCLAIWMDAVCSNDRIKWFKCLGSKYHSWPIVVYIIFKMEKVVEFWFIEPLESPCCSPCQEEHDSCMKVLLKLYIRCAAGIKCEEVTVYYVFINIWYLWLPDKWYEVRQCYPCIITLRWSNSREDKWCGLGNHLKITTS